MHGDCSHERHDCVPIDAFNITVGEEAFIKSGKERGRRDEKRVDPFIGPRLGFEVSNSKSQVILSFHSNLVDKSLPQSRCSQDWTPREVSDRIP